MRWIRPNKNEFLALFGPEVRNIWICSPWISRDGVEYLREAFERTAPGHLLDLEIWTRMNVKDYEAGLSDYVGLAQVVDRVKEKNPSAGVSLWCADGLHAKCYVTDRGALLGSCNLSRAGFNTNVELAMRMEATEALPQLSLREVLRSELRQVSADEWNEFLGGLSNLPTRSVTDTTPESDDSWESFLQGLLSEGPPHPKTPLR